MERLVDEFTMQRKTFKISRRKVPESIRYMTGDSTEGKWINVNTIIRFQNKAAAHEDSVTYRYETNNLQVCPDVEWQTKCGGGLHKNCFANV